MTIDAENIIQLLVRAVADPSQLGDVIGAYQEIVWGGQIDELPQAEVLRDLAYNLDYYEPDLIKRRESPEFFDGKKALEEIAMTISKLKG